MEWIYTKENPLRVVTLCSGYESQCMAIRNLGIPFDLVAWAEFDPESKAPLEKQPAVIAHNAVFPEYKDRNLGDMTKIDWEKVPDFDLLFYSTPCQSISNAGLQHGFVEGSGTRSSIIWNVRDAIKIKRPKYAILENAATLSPEFIESALALAEHWGIPTKFFNESLHALGTPEDLEQILLDLTPVRIRIRKLTPKECMRLQAVSDEDFQKMQDAGLSNSALYKLAGNSICIAPLEGIFTQLFRADSDCLF